MIVHYLILILTSEIKPAGTLPGHVDNVINERGYKRTRVRAILSYLQKLNTLNHTTNLHICCCDRCINKFGVVIFSTKMPA